MRAELIREFEANDTTLGYLSVFDDNGNTLISLATMEPAWKQNLPSVSCIPKGSYDLVKRHSATHGHHFWLQNVIDRQMILIHAGNFRGDTRGCILVGLYRDPCNVLKDNMLRESKKALELLDLIILNKIKITIS